MIRSSVHARNSTSATRHGSTKTVLRGSFGAASNGLVLRVSGLSRSARSSSTFSVNPVPTRPA